MKSPLSKHRRYRTVAIFVLVVALLLLGANITEAVPVAPLVVKLSQPDGSVFMAIPFGDEWYHGYEYGDYTIVKNESDGYWYFAAHAPDGRLLPSGQKVGIDQPLDLSPNLRDQSRQYQQPTHTLPRAQTISSWPGATGSQPVLIILADFSPSQSLGTTATEWSTSFFDHTPGAKSVKNFYEQASYGQFTLIPAEETRGIANDGVIEVTLSYPHPGTNGDNRQITKDALTAANPYINYAAYDLDNNNAVSVTELHLIVIPRGFETSFGGTEGACSPSVWGHRWSLYESVPAPTLDGVTVADDGGGGGYMQFGEWHETTGAGCSGASGNMATIGIMAHELGHDINWPDLYDTDGSSSGVGNWSIMATGSWGSENGEPVGTTPSLPDPFSKAYQGWLSPIQINSNTNNISIPNSAENPTVYQLLDNPNGIDWEFGATSGVGEYFLVENRQQVGFDAGLERIASNADGCLIWHIDESRTSSNSNNDNESRKHVDVEEANGTQDMDTASNRGDNGDPWPGSSNNSTFASSSVPNSDLYDGSASNVTISNISSDTGGECTVDFILTSFQPPAINVSPAAVVATTMSGAQTTATVTLHNAGEVDLNWFVGGNNFSSASLTAMASLSEGFDDTASLPDWVSQNNSDVAGTTDWFQGNSQVFSAHSGSSDSYIGANHNNTSGSQISNWLMTPELDFLENSRLSFWTRTTSGSAWPDRIQVWVSTSGASTDVGSTPSSTGDFTNVVLDINENLAVGGYPETWTEYSLDLSAHSGQSGRVAFRYYVPTSAGPTGVNSNYIGLDTVEYTSCSGVSEISWFSIDSSSGAISPASSTDIEISFDSTGLAEDTYSAVLCIDSNDPSSPRVQLPVSLIVEPCVAPAAVSDLELDREGEDIQLEWTDTGADLYEIHVTENDPYFSPNGVTLVGSTAETTYDLSEVALSESVVTYALVAVNVCGATSAAAAKLAEFNFALQPGSTALSR